MQDITIDINTVPADVWLCIFEHLTPSSLSSLAQTCSAFHRLTHRCLLRDIRWTNIQAALRNVEDWRGDWKQWCAIPRTLTIKLPFEDKTAKSGSTWVATPSRPLINASLYNTIHHQLLSFTRLQSLILTNTLITPVLYPILASLSPSLHTLSITQSTYSHTGIWADSIPMLPPSDTDTLPSEPYEYIDDFDFSSLSIKELTLGTFRDSTGPLAQLHPFNLITASSLTSLTLTCGVSFLLCLRDLTSPSPSSSSTSHAHPSPFSLLQTGLPTIQSISLTVIKLTHDGELAISSFLALCTNPELRVSLRVIDTEIRDRGDTTSTTSTTNTTTTPNHAVGVGIRNVWKYQGPVAVLRLLAASRFPPSSSSSSNQIQNPISHLMLTDALTTKSLISGLERLGSLDSSSSSSPPARPHIKVLSVKMHVWDVEVLYAIRGLFRECVQEVKVEFGVGSVGENFAITLGANILPDLKNLRVLKIIQESSCVALTREGRANRNYVGFNTHHHQGPVDYDSDDDDYDSIGGLIAHPTAAAHTNVNAGVGVGVTWNNIHHTNNTTHVPAWYNNHTSSGPSNDAAAAKTSATQTPTPFDDTDFESYLLGWNRYCPKLRYVQLKRGSAWVRRFEGDAWVERAVVKEDSEGDD